MIQRSPRILVTANSVEWRNTPEQSELYMGNNWLLKGKRMVEAEVGSGVVFSFEDGMDFENVKIPPESGLQDKQVRERA